MIKLRYFWYWNVHMPYKRLLRKKAERGFRRDREYLEFLLDEGFCRRCANVVVYGKSMSRKRCNCTTEVK